ncbi:hypothetical protein KKA95_03495 [Patescibacteria group bacterium]|nr:hypothetical protein [Patescibacteria group bacterium]
MEFKKSILVKASNLIIAHIVIQLGEETRRDVEAITQEAFAIYERLKTIPSGKRGEMLSCIRKEAVKIREKINELSKKS